MTEKSITREALLASFGSLATQFTSSLEKAQTLEKTFDGSRVKLAQAISGHLEHAQQSLPQANPLQAPLDNFVQAIEKTSREWDAKVAGRQKGVSFRQGFEDALLVFVSGKVKSGKSSLGNYMAWGHTDPTDRIKSQTPPERRPLYKSHDRKNVEGGDRPEEAVNKREFRVGATEATSSIQSFSLPGLTWVDSPGLHSLKEENGNLAREYLDHADLILYTMKSDAPGRASDLAEISDLLHKDKRALLLLTGSDDTDADVNDSGDLIQRLVMKDDERRAKQQDYVRGELKKIPNGDKLEIVSISSRYAQEHASDSAAFLDSGIGPFCATLQDICQSEGVKIKQRVPMRNLHLFLAACESDLAPYQDLINGFRPVLVKLDGVLKNQLHMHSRDGRRDLNQFIDHFFESLESKRNDAEDVNGQLKAFGNTLGEKFQEIAANRLHAIANELTKEFQADVKSTYEQSLLIQIPDFELDTVTEKVPVGTRSGTKKRNSLIGTLVGGGIGFLTAGPVGLTIGAGVGGGLGRVSGDSATMDYRDLQITVGDNLQDIRRQLQDTHCETLEALLQKNSTELWQAFGGSIDRLLQDISAEIMQFKSALQEIRTQTQRAL